MRDDIVISLLRVYGGIHKGIFGKTAFNGGNFPVFP